jgi:hypothetical protein
MLYINITIKKLISMFIILSNMKIEVIASIIIFLVGIITAIIIKGRNVIYSNDFLFFLLIAFITSIITFITIKRRSNTF